jgi:hypothetical protein
LLLVLILLQGVGVEVVESFVATDATHSDHFPVVADLLLLGGGGGGGGGGAAGGAAAAGGVAVEGAAGVGLQQPPVAVMKSGL